MMIQPGRTIVQTAGDPQPLALSTTLVSSVTVTALETNTGRVALGDLTASAAYGTERGLMLYPNQSEKLEGGLDLSTLYVDVVADDEGISWWAEV